MARSVTPTITVLIMAWMAALLFSGCGHAIDLERERMALLQADRDFAAASSSDGYIEAYHRNLAGDAILLPPGGDVRAGRERIYAEDTTEGLLGLLEWTPEDAGVARSGDLGWTWGRWVFTIEGEEGDSKSYGKYLFVWRKTDGRWKAVANIWNDNPPPE